MQSTLTPAFSGCIMLAMSGEEYRKPRFGDFFAERQRRFQVLRSDLHEIRASGAERLAAIKSVGVEGFVRRTITHMDTVVAIIYRVLPHQ